MMTMNLPKSKLTIIHEYGNDKITYDLSADTSCDELISHFANMLVAMTFHPDSVNRALYEVYSERADIDEEI